MEKYSNVLENMIMSQRHAFIYGEEKEREQYLKKLGEKYSFQMAEKRPIGIYITDSGLEDNKNPNCEMWRIHTFQEFYVDFLIIERIINKMMKEIPKEELTSLEDNILSVFHRNKLQSLQELNIELEKSLKTYKDEYNHYLKTGEITDNFQEKLKIERVVPDLLLPKLKDSLQTVSYFSLLIDKKGDYGKVYTQAINSYIASTCTGYLVMNIGCQDYRDWATSYDLTGNIIQGTHDYSSIVMDEWILKRDLTKKEQ